MATPRAAVRAAERARRRERLDLDRFEGLIATPHDFGATAASATSPNTLVLPGNARLALSHSAALNQVGVTVDLTSGLDFSHPALAADVVSHGSYGERGKTVAVNRGLAVDAPAGTFTLYIVDALGVHRVIGTATFT